jgi:hypothetical protein
MHNVRDTGGVGGELHVATAEVDVDGLPSRKREDDEVPSELENSMKKK